MRLVTDIAILGDGRMLVGKRTLFVGMAFVAGQIDSRSRQVVLHLPVGIMAVGTDHLPFLDRMVRWHRVLCIDVGMTLVTDVRVVDRHRDARFASNVRVLNIQQRLSFLVGMRIVAVGAGDAIASVGTALPGERGRSIAVAL